MDDLETLSKIVTMLLATASQNLTNMHTLLQHVHVAPKPEPHVPAPNLQPHVPDPNHQLPVPVANPQPHVEAAQFPRGQVQNNPLFRCHKCNTGLNSGYAYDRHMRYCGKPKNLFCLICNRAMHRRDQLKRHYLDNHGMTRDEVKNLM